MNGLVHVAMVQEYKPVAQLKNIWDKMDGTHIFNGQWWYGLPPLIPFNFEFLNFK
jgi:hypothetical protein